MKLCLPAFVYLIIGTITAIYTLFSHKVSNAYLFLSFIFILIWTYLLNLVCNAGYAFISWLIVLFPFIMLLISIPKKALKEEKKVNEESKK
jgi:hypothetical protein